MLGVCKFTPSKDNGIFLELPISMATTPCVTVSGPKGTKGDVEEATMETFDPGHVPISFL